MTQPSKGTSVLASLTADVMKEKKAAARTLTPHWMVNPQVPEVPGVFLSSEAMVTTAKDLRRQAQLLIDIAHGLDVLAGVPEAVEGMAVVTAEVEAKLKEIEGDRKAAERAAAKGIAIVPEADEELKSEEESEFAADFKAKAEAAQKSVFGIEPTTLDEFGTDAAWVCSTHAKRAAKTAKSGRQFTGCPDCNQFAR